MSPYPCPCCGFLVFDDPPGSFDICQVCGWEDDISQLRFPTMGGAQAPLVDCQRAASERSVVASGMNVERDSAWRPLDPERDAIEVPEPGVDYGVTYPKDPTELYYWR